MSEDEGFLPRLSLGPFTKMLLLDFRLQRLRRGKLEKFSLGYHRVSGSSSP